PAYAVVSAYPGQESRPDLASAKGKRPSYLAWLRVLGIGSMGILICVACFAGIALRASWLRASTPLPAYSTAHTVSVSSPSEHKTSPVSSSIATSPHKKPARPPLTKAQEAFVNAVETGNVRHVKALLNREVAPDTKRSDGTPVLVIAADKGKEPLVAALLEKRANA